MNVSLLIWMLVFASYLGFCVENLFIALRHGYIDNRGGYLPALIGYGILVDIVYLLFGTPQEPALWRNVSDNRVLSDILYIIIAFLAVSMGELALGTLVEKLCHFSWWDYTSIPLHLGKYTSVPTSTGFSLILYSFMSEISPVISFFTSHGNTALRQGVGQSILLMLILDYLSSTIYMLKHHQTHIMFRKAVQVPDFADRGFKTVLKTRS